MLTVDSLFICCLQVCQLCFTFKDIVFICLMDFSEIKNLLDQWGVKKRSSIFLLLQFAKNKTCKTLCVHVRTNMDTAADLSLP